ncbi:MAG: 1-deoxy-D-xylulose-5-phosphate reductoisomerase [Planctomycetia bacterium]|nr:1-deoxy-D-xylulose-5-phosphate reductoisomerase [Planctomycetia bacterium]
MSTRTIAVIGATGSIGTSALDVIAHSQGALRVGALAVKRSTKELTSLALRFHPEVVAVADETADLTPLESLPSEIEVVVGARGLEELVRRPTWDVTLLSVVGSVGLTLAWNVLDVGGTLALANKEALVSGGAILMDLLRRKGGVLIPVDSEHSAIYQCLLSRRSTPRSPEILSADVSRLILTASGGPFRTWSAEELRHATVSDALRHPTWQMGAKVTIDSASMMNKALELIEARWLFGLDVDKLSVVIHPQSIVHSMVEFVDGAVLAQLSPPDMRLPIQFALYEGRRASSPARKFDWTSACQLEFYPPDMTRFPALALGLEAARAGGTSGAVLNAANEVAVAAFQRGKLRFDQIAHVCREIVQRHEYQERPTLDTILTLDAWARKETEQWISQ